MSNLKSGFSKLKTQATNAFDNLEQKLEKLDSEVISPTQQSRPISTPVNPEDVEKINWDVPKHENSNERLEINLRVVVVPHLRRCIILIL